MDMEQEPRAYARRLYWCGWSVAQISRELKLNPNTVASWKNRDKWDDAPLIDRVDAALETRLILLIAKESKEGKDYKEIDLLTRQLERTAKIRGSTEFTDLPKKIDKPKRERSKPKGNHITEEQQAELIRAFHDSLYDYQKLWYVAGDQHRIRNILKSRQIGATWYFAREAIIDALKTGRNQIFLSASKNQAHVFKHYIVQFVQNTTDVTLRGDPITLENGAQLYFLGTNARTAQSYHGNLYFDEYFWTYNFLELRKVASGMAVHKHWRQTFFSTPSSYAHEAYTYWNGENYNKNQKQKVDIDITHKTLANGQIGADGQWRHMVTIEDAQNGGCDLFDINALKQEYSQDEFANLFMCEFVDDSKSVFPLALLMPAMVDSAAVWQDFSKFKARPFGQKPVWIGYDPALSGDSAGLAVVAPPEHDGGKFRVLETFQFQGLDFQAQAKKIEDITKRYNVVHIAIDSTGLGQGVLQLVKNFFPAVQDIHYSVPVKNTLVFKAKEVFENERIEFDAGERNIASAFMAISQTQTSRSQALTFQASRARDINHADIAWAIMHALIREPLGGNHFANQSFIKIL